MSLFTRDGTGSECAGGDVVTSVRFSHVANSNRNIPDPRFCSRLNVARREIMQKIEKSTKHSSVNLLWAREFAPRKTIGRWRPARQRGYELEGDQWTNAIKWPAGSSEAGEPPATAGGPHQSCAS